MPTYQYACTECGHAFEQFQSFSDASLTECPECRGRLRKVYNAVGVVFKGSGFYVTDNRGKSSTAPPARKDGESKSEGGESKSEGGAKPSDAAPAPASPAPTSGEPKTH